MNYCLLSILKTTNSWCSLRWTRTPVKLSLVTLGPFAAIGSVSVGRVALCVSTMCPRSMDYWEAYQTVIPSKRHEAVGKDSGKTSSIERLNHTVRQRIARLVGKSLSFSKQVGNHIGAIWYFISEYNRQIRLIIEADKMAPRYYPSFT